MKRLIALLLIIPLVLVGCNEAEAYIPPDDKSWANPGKIEVSNFYAGARAEYTIEVHNGNDEEVEFSIAYNQEMVEGEVYSKKSPIKGDIYIEFQSIDAKDWVTLSDTKLTVGAREEGTFDVTLVLPKDAILPDKWLFSILVVELGQTGIVTVRHGCDCLVHMR